MREHIYIRTLPLLLAIIALYFLMHPYQGLVHDARLYLLQALNYLHPDLYGSDVFLKYGSQDSYTLFTPLFAAAISLFGAELAASLFTFVSIVALLFGAGVFARTLVPERVAWLGLGLLVLFPGFYGQGVTFAVLEEFVTPRLIAEALVLFGLAAWLRERRTLSGVLLLAGFLLHPIMTLPALILMALVTWGLPHWRKAWPLVLVAAAVVALALAGALPLEQFRFDAAWWPIAERVPHLNIVQWTSHDWARVGTIFSTLVVAALCLAPAGQRVAIGMLVTCIGTLLLSWIGGDLLKIVIIVQGQAWRSMWLATAIAALLMPWIAASFWQQARLRRCSVLLLITAWVIGYQNLALCFSIPAAIAALCGNVRVPERFARLATIGAGILLVVVVLSMLALTLSEIDLVDASYGTGLPATLRKICADGIVPAALLLGVWTAASHINSRRAVALLSCVAMLPLLFIGKASAEAWSSRVYSLEAHESFAVWRSLIPAGADVLWATKLMRGGDPTAAWLLLERPSYYSSVQVNSGLFSRPAAIELLRRNKKIPLSLPTEMPVTIKFEDEANEGLWCKDIPVRYIVTSVAISDARLVAAPPSLGPPFDTLQLRICP
jgi:hypothetical protein